MKDFKEQITKQLIEFYEGDPWVTDNFREKVLSMDENLATTKFKNFNHNVAQIVNHMTAWRNFVSMKMKGDKVHDISLNSEGDWPTVVSWQDSIDQFNRSQNDMISALRDFPEEHLQIIVPLRKYNFQYLIDGIVKHDYYHYGQINCIIAAINSQ